MTKGIIEKISSYNLFNNLLPGILFVYAISNITHFNLLVDNVLIAIFLYYFVGLVISRFGSLVIQPLLAKVKFIRFADYKDFLSASEKDGKIELLSEVNNMFRTFISFFVFVSLTLIYDKIAVRFCIPIENTIIALIIALLVLFLFSYRKQTAFIRKRVERLNNKK
jgi:signal transduction histidine kinase